MGPKFFKKSTEAGKEDLAQPEKGKGEGVLPESKEILASREREHLKQEVLDEIKETEKPAKKRPVSQIPKPTEPTTVKSEDLLRIEAVLEEDLEDAYFKMKPKLQEEFKTKGEKTALKIEKILQKTKVKAKDIFKLIFKWLKIIPGVNKFFIKQEAKIKTDRVIKLKQK